MTTSSTVRGTPVTTVPAAPSGASPGDASARMVVRRGRLVDVPSVARLVGEAPIGAAPALEQPEAQRLLRLVLTHVGIGFGEIWVGHLDAGLRAAVVLLPPPDESVERQLRTALRLGSAVGPETLGPEIALPPGHWLLLPVGHDAGPVLHRALAALDVRGVPVCALPGQADDVLPALGFADPKGRGLLRRPAAQRPRRSIEAG